jgi:hypothetical protein
MAAVNGKQRVAAAAANGKQRAASANGGGKWQTANGGGGWCDPSGLKIRDIARNFDVVWCVLAVKSRG